MRYFFAFFILSIWTFTAAALDGACGAANGTMISAVPQSGLCSKGSASAVADATPYRWACAGSSGGKSASCSAFRITNKVASIRNWAKCDGATDDRDAVANAFSLAKNGAFTLQVDCNLRIHIGNDIARPIFVDNKTSVKFTSAGQIFVDNEYIPAFAIVNSSDIEFENWKVVYRVHWYRRGVLQTSHSMGNPGGLYRNGAWVEIPGVMPNSGYFVDNTLKSWLTKNRGITYESGTGPAWTGADDTAAIFFLAGSATNVKFNNLRMHVGGDARADQFIPMGVSFNYGQRNNQKVSKGMSVTSKAYAIPSNLTFKNVIMDGLYMGFQGKLQNAVFDKIHSFRYSDLQEANGSTIGGIGAWAAPPHLFYLNYNAEWDLGLMTKDITITDVVDEGIRVGNSDRLCNSLKIGGHGLRVDNYRTHRAEGVADLLAAKDAVITKLSGTYDSSVLNYRFSAIRFPGAGSLTPGFLNEHPELSAYVNYTIDNVQLQDLAAITKLTAFTHAVSPFNKNLRISNTQITLNRWAEPNFISLNRTGLNYKGTGTSIFINYKLLNAANQPMQLLGGREEEMSWYFSVSPQNVRAGDAATLTWGSVDAQACTHNGAWEDQGRREGSTLVTSSAPQTISYSYSCMEKGGKRRDLTLKVNHLKP